MAKKNTKDSHSTTHGNVYKDEWAEEFDIDESATARNDSERLDRAIEMGVEAARTLERDETLGLIPPRQRSRRRPAAILAVGALAIAGVGVALASNRSEPEPQQGVEVIDAIKQDDGTYRAHLDFESSEKITQKEVIVPQKVESSKALWAIRVHATIDTSSQWMSSCEVYNGVHIRSITNEDWCYDADFRSKDTAIRQVEAGIDDISQVRQSDIDQIHILPTIKNEYDTEDVVPKIIVNGASVSMDIDFIPVSTLAVPWDRSEPLRGTNSTFIAFSGSLEDFKLDSGNGGLALYVYSAHGCGYGYTSDAPGWCNLDLYNLTRRREKIEELGFNDENASGYLFIEARDGGYLPGPLWWQLN